MKYVLMKASIVSFLVCSSMAYANSTIHFAIPSANAIVPSHEMVLDLNVLPSKVPYFATCSLHSSASVPVEMTFTPRLAPNGGYGVAKLNGKPMQQNVGSLQPGDNTLTFMVSVATLAKTDINTFVFKNLDHQEVVTVTSCEAKPVTDVHAISDKVKGGYGYFYISNYMPYFLDITVGDYFPTPYCIYPYSKGYIEVSTGYQNIEVLGIHN